MDAAMAAADGIHPEGVTCPIATTPADDASAGGGASAGEERRKRMEIRRQSRLARGASAPLFQQPAEAKRRRYMELGSEGYLGGGALRASPTDYLPDHHDTFAVEGRAEFWPAASSLSAPAVFQASNVHQSQAWLQAGPPWRPEGASPQQPAAPPLEESSLHSGVTHTSGSNWESTSKLRQALLGPKGEARPSGSLRPGPKPGPPASQADGPRKDTWQWPRQGPAVNTDLALGLPTVSPSSAASQQGPSGLSEKGASSEQDAAGTAGSRDDAGPSARQGWQSAGDISSKQVGRGTQGDACPPHGMLAVIGRRQDMEDTLTVLPSFARVPRQCASTASLASEGDREDGEGTTPLHFFGIYDGHGGCQVAKYCAERMHLTVADELEKTAARKGGVLPLAEGLQEILPSAFKRIDEELAGRCPYPEACGHNATCQHEPIAPEAVGTTAVVAVVSPSHIVVGNCGDSRAVLSRKGRAVPLSDDHKPEREDERRRVEAAGGQVIYRNGYRVLGELAMSRAIGDRFLKPYVIAEPEVKWVERTEEDECIVMGSDGLWDVISNEEACNIATRCLLCKHVPAPMTQPGSPFAGQDPQAATAAALLTKVALARGSGDNITVVVIVLFPREEK